jgi:hypothetical protein
MADFGDLESRAALAEEKLKGLTLRVDTLQEVLSTEPTTATIDKPLKDYQLHMLGQLRALRKKMDDEGNPAAVTAERDALAAENAKLQETVTKLNYRCVRISSPARSRAPPPLVCLTARVVRAGSSTSWSTSKLRRTERKLPNKDNYFCRGPPLVLGTSRLGRCALSRADRLASTTQYVRAPAAIAAMVQPNTTR